MDGSGLLVPLLLLEAAALWCGWPSWAGHGWQQPPCAAAAAAPGDGLVVVLAMDSSGPPCAAGAAWGGNLVVGLDLLVPLLLLRAAAS